MVSTVDRWRHWLLVGAFALGLTLSGAAHEALFHGPDRAAGHDHDCCASTPDADPDDEAGPRVQHDHEHGDHECPLCFQGGAASSGAGEEAAAPLEAGRADRSLPDAPLGKSRRSPESERGPPRVV